MIAVKRYKNRSSKRQSIYLNPRFSDTVDEKKTIVVETSYKKENLFFWFTSRHMSADSINRLLRRHVNWFHFCCFRITHLRGHTSRALAVGNELVSLRLTCFSWLWVLADCWPWWPWNVDLLTILPICRTGVVCHQNSTGFVGNRCIFPYNATL